jgi:hypothetical protein
MGIVAAGAVISRYKPRPRYLAAWNVFVELLEVVGHLSYSLLTCTVDDLHGEMKPDHRLVSIAQQFLILYLLNISYFFTVTTQISLSMRDHRLLSKAQPFWILSFLNTT